MTTLYFEDLEPGRTYDLGEVAVDEQEMVDFARRFDPQPFHVDPEAAKDTPFGGLIASGWYTCALFMRMYVDTVVSRTVSHGSPGGDELRWLAPVRAGDVLHGRLTILDSWRSSKRPDRGTVLIQSELLRDGEPVLRMKFRGMFGRRPPAPDYLRGPTERR
ncbi:MAG: MaoC family dehydratase [Streptosporangiaceae bacterium]